MLRHLKGVLVLAGCTVNTIVCFIPLILLAVVKLLLPIAAVRAFLTRLIMRIGEAWVGVNSMLFDSANDWKVDVRGLDDLSRDSWYLVISNHQTWVDIVLLQKVLNRRIPFLKFFIKQELVWFPVLGIAWWAMDMPFMKRYSKSYLAKHPEKKGRDLEATRKACEKFRRTPTSVINFIEGTRFSEQKRVKRESPFTHLLPPRAGGIALALDSMGNMFDAVLDVTIVYSDDPPPRFWQMLCGEAGNVTVSVQQRAVEPWMLEGDYTNDREFRRTFHRWLTDVWQEKDDAISDAVTGNGVMSHG